eukprot:gene17438-19181_t
MEKAKRSDKIITYDKRDDKSMKQLNKPKKETFVKKSNIWTFEERTRLAAALADERGLQVKHPEAIYKYFIKTKNCSDIVKYCKYHRLLRQGKPFDEFKDAAALDTWIQLAEQNTNVNDKSAEQSLPQVMTVAALEKMSTSANNYSCSNIYNFLSIILKGEKIPDLPPTDAEIVLNLIDDLIVKLADSVTTLQKEYLHEAFAVLRKSTEINQKKFPSTNPLRIPSNLLEFQKKTKTKIDFGLQWRTTVRE